jgi:hypothetical protein
MSEENDNVVSVTIGAHLIKIKALSAFESLQADDIVGGGESNDTKVNKVYAICSIREIDGEKVHPLRNRLEFAELAQRLTLAELVPLMGAVNRQFSESIGDDLKNALGGQESASSPPPLSTPKVD